MGICKLYTKKWKHIIAQNKVVEIVSKKEKKWSAKTSGLQNQIVPTVIR